MSTVHLHPVLYYTPVDPYSVDIDNRPIYNLSTNINALAAAMIGSGYGEHVAVAGGLLTPGKAVRLLDNNMIKYPDASDIGDGTAIYGLVIGKTPAGLNKVIWNAGFLDLADVGLAAIVANATPGYYIEVTFNPQAAANIRIVESPADKYHVLGRIISVSGIISIGSVSVDDSVVASSGATQANYHNLLGLTRSRNLSLLTAIDATPVQYDKRTVYQQSYGTAQNQINPLKSQLSTTGAIIPMVASTAQYDTTAFMWKLKEVYSQLLVAGSDSISGSAWPSTVYNSRIPTPDGTGTAPSYELQRVGSSPDYTQSVNLPLYKQFTVSKYYQYTAVSPGTPAYGKVSAILTVFDPEGVNRGGETSKILVWDFFEYDLNNGLEIRKRRAVITGSAAVTLYDNVDIIPTNLKTI